MLLRVGLVAFFGGFLSSCLVVYSLFLVCVFVAFPVGVHSLARFVSVAEWLFLSASLPSLCKEAKEPKMSKMMSQGGHRQMQSEMLMPQGD